jgi:hypothetical protein
MRFALLLGVAMSRTIDVDQHNAGASLLDQAMKALSASLVSSDESKACFSNYTSLPQRDRFFSKAERPPGVGEEKFGRMLARGGIHPRGVVLDSEFFELPLRFNKTLLRAELKALRQSGAKWAGAKKDNQDQGVVSQHLKLALGQNGDLHGPFADVDDRLRSSPYIRSVLKSFKSVIGNVAFMRLPPGGHVEYHFDTSPYWFNRVRVHVPVTTNSKVVFSCGQMGEEVKLNMRAGRVYLFDNHLGHQVHNGGEAGRVHLTIDLIGSRRFWEMVKKGKAIGSGASKKQPKFAPLTVAPSDAEVVLEQWDDDALVDCQSIAKATKDTAAALSSLSEADVSQLQGIVTTWCFYVSSTSGSMTRGEEVRLLQMLVAQWDCGRPQNSQAAAAAAAEELEALTPAALSPTDVVDAVSEMYRRTDADAELRAVGAEHQPPPQQKMPTKQQPTPITPNPVPANEGAGDCAPCQGCIQQFEAGGCNPHADVPAACKKCVKCLASHAKCTAKEGDAATPAKEAKAADDCVPCQECISRFEAGGCNHAALPAGCTKCVKCLANRATCSAAAAPRQQRGGEV